MHLRAALPLLATVLLAAAPDLRMDLRTDLGSDPAAQIRLVPPGIWDGLLLGSRTPAPPPRNHRDRPGATVAVSDFLTPSHPRAESLRLYVADLRERLLRGFQAPPPSQGALELREFMESDPSHPELSTLERTQSMQERYNRVPPNGSPVELK